MTKELHEAIKQTLADRYPGDESLLGQQTNRLYNKIFRGVRDYSESAINFPIRDTSDAVRKRVLALGMGLAGYYHIGNNPELQALPPAGEKVKNLITPGGVELLRRQKSREAILKHASLSHNGRVSIEQAIALLDARRD